MSTEDLYQASLNYHALSPAGKLSIKISKPTESQYDLSLAYSPGVAAPVKAIKANPDDAYKYTAKGNLVGVISNGTAILGLGNLGALASKPVMEGKAVLFKRFANIDVFDIEVDELDPEKFVETVVRIAPTFGGINLEDIKGPECFYIETELQKRLNIPVFHDDQHGTAVVVAAGLLNALEIQNKKIDQVKIVCLGAGAAGIATIKLLNNIGFNPNNICMVDSQGIIHHKRKDLNEHKKALAIHTELRTFEEAIKNVDVFIGVSGPNLLSVEMLKSMAPNPIVFALSNPVPEINVELAKSVRRDLIIATGRSDYPNQVNNVLCFPYLFRGALDVRATCINQAMLLAAVHAIRKLAHEPIPTSVMKAYTDINELKFGKEYILPTPLDPRLIECVPAAVSRAARETNVATI